MIVVTVVTVVIVVTVMTIVTVRTKKKKLFSPTNFFFQTKKSQKKTFFFTRIPALTKKISLTYFKTQIVMKLKNSNCD